MSFKESPDRPYTIFRPKNKEEWLAGRTIGGSEAAAILNMSPWESPMELFMRLSGVSDGKKDVSNAATARGTKLEKDVRAFVSVYYPQYRVVPPPANNWVFRRKDKHYMTGSLDGYLVDRSDHDRRGVLEIKTHDVRGREDSENWLNGKLPQQYYIQVLHYLNVTGYDFAVLVASLAFYDYNRRRDRVLDHIEIRPYYFDAGELREDLEMEEKAVTDFWNENVQKGIPPKVVMKLS